MADGDTTDTLRAVHDAAGERLRAEVGEDTDQLGGARMRVTEAAQAALSAGDSIAAIADAESAGAADARAALGPDALKATRRAGSRYLSAQNDLVEAINRGLALGYSQRELARTAGLRPAAARTLLAAQSETPTELSGDAGSEGADTPAPPAA